MSKATHTPSQASLIALDRAFEEVIAEPFREAVDDFANAAADALYGPLIHELERKIAERDAR